jgi:hypothetical protein
LDLRGHLYVISRMQWAGNIDQYGVASEFTSGCSRRAQQEQ